MYRMAMSTSCTSSLNSAATASRGAVARRSTMLAMAHKVRLWRLRSITLRDLSRADGIASNIALLRFASLGIDMTSAFKSDQRMSRAVGRVRRRATWRGHSLRGPGSAGGD